MTAPAEGNMAPFHFSLEQVLRYRQQLEEQAMLALAEARAARDKRRRERDECVAALAEQRVKLASAATLPAEERWLITGYIAGLTQDLEQARIDLIVLEEEMDRCRQALTQRSQDKKLLEKLKDRQAKRHAQTETYRDQKSYDDIATIRFVPSTL